MTTRALSVVAVVASSPGGNTDRLVGQVLSAAAREGATTTALHLGPDARDPAQLDDYLQRLAGADAIVLGTPMYRATYAGVLKEFLDRLRRGGPAEGFASALRAKPIGIVATGGSDHHFLGVDPLITLLVRFFAAYVVPPALYGVSRSSSPAEDAAAGTALAAEAAGLGRALVALGETIRADGRLSEARPQV
jgi:NAD(P)H-dependent FMN reductase